MMASELTKKDVKRNVSHKRRSIGELLTFFGPLALTQVMMSGGTPIVNAGIARRPDPIDGLAVFAVAFSLSVFLNSLCFGMEPATVAMAKGPRSMKRILTFGIALGIGLSLLELAVGLTPLGDLVFKGFFGLKGELAHQASMTLVAFSPLPLLLTLRSIARGMLTAISHTARVGWGTLFRLLAMIAVIAGGAHGLPFSGHILGALAFLAGVLVETLIVLTGMMRYRDELPGDNDNDVAASYQGIFRFVSPLLVAGLFGVAINSVMNAVLTRTSDANLAVSVFSVIRSIVWLFASMLLAFHQLVIARATDTDGRRRVFAFASMIVLGVTFILSVLAYTQAGRWIMRVVIGVDGEVLEASAYTLLFVPLLPIAMGVRSYLRGEAIRDRMTSHVLASSIFSLVTATLVGVLMIDYFKIGAMVALAMWILSQVAESLLIVILRLRSHPPVRASLD
jgi:hypothetical protein